MHQNWQFGKLIGAVVAAYLRLRVPGEPKRKANLANTTTEE